MEPGEPLTSNYPIFADYLKECQKENPDLKEVEKKYDELKTTVNMAHYSHNVMPSDFYIAENFVRHTEKISHKFYKHKPSVTIKKKEMGKLSIDALVLHYTVFGYDVLVNDKAVVISVKK